jgi:hypothetical protein
MKKKNQLYVIFLLTSLTGFTQNKIEWSEDYNLSKSDYQAQAPNSGSIQTVSGSFYVEYEVGGLSLITTRNLNENVKCYFQKDASYIDDGDDASTQRLIRYQQLIFDLYELQARNLRKQFFEERKRLLTKGPAILWEEVSAENAKLVAKMESETNHGSELNKIIEWEQVVKSELEKLAMYCKTCIPKKNKRK